MWVLTRPPNQSQKKCIIGSRHDNPFASISVHITMLPSWMYIQSIGLLYTDFFVIIIFLKIDPFTNQIAQFTNSNQMGFFSFYIEMEAL